MSITRCRHKLFFGETIFVSVAELKNSSSGSYLTASLRNTYKREDADSSAHITCMIMVCTICGKLIIPNTCSSEMRPKYICAAQPYRGIYMYARIHGQR